MQDRYQSCAISRQTISLQDAHVSKAITWRVTELSDLPDWYPHWPAETLRAAEETRARLSASQLESMLKLANKEFKCTHHPADKIVTAQGWISLASGSRGILVGRVGVCGFRRYR
jgi:hypothetical protein